MMIKKIRKPAIALFVLGFISGHGFTQSLTLSSAKTIVKGFFDQATMESTVLVTNNTGGSISVKVQRNIIYEVPGSANNFCWGPTCYPDFVSLSPTPAIINGGATESSFKADYTPSNTIGKTTIEYVFFDENNPADSVAYRVRYITLPSPLLAGSISFCAGDSTSLDAGAGYDSYLWSNGATTQNIWTGTPGSFSCDVTIDTVTRSSNTASVTQSSVLTPVITGDTAFCTGDQATLDAGTGYASYLWSDLSTSQTVSASTGGTYTVTITTLQGCTGSGSIDVTALSTPATPTINWNGTVLSSGTYSGYQWGYEGFMLYGETNNTITPTVNGNWELWVYNSYGCSSNSSLQINNVGIEDDDTDYNLAIYPNPTGDLLHIMAETGSIIRVMDAAGHLVMKSVATDDSITLPVSGWSGGIYSVHVVQGNKHTSKQVVIRH